MMRNKISTLINIVGLSLGMACSFLTLLYVIGEFSYEKNQINRDQIFRVLTSDQNRGDMNVFAINYGALASILKEEFPEVEKASVLESRVNRPFYVRTDKEYNLEKGVVYEVYPDYFDIFTVPILQGNPMHLIDDPQSIVLSKEMAFKYFGDQDPMGKSIFFQYDSEDIGLTVTGIMDKLPGKSGFNPDFITRFDPKRYEAYMGWDFVIFEVYLRLSQNADIPLLEKKLNDLGKKYHPEGKQLYQLQNAKDFYLESEHIYGSHIAKGNKLSMLVFSGIGILILLIACINYIILATAESTLRYKEIGIKKVVGANRIGLISQIQMESLFIALLSLPLALIIVERSKGLISSFFGQEFADSYSGNWPFIIGFIVITLLVGSISGSYISLHLSRLKPIDILVTRNPRKGNPSLLRKVLIGFQLLIFVVLFTSVTIIQKQIKYALNLHPEFELENLLIINDDQQRISNLDVFKTELEKHPDIELVSSAFSNIMSRNRWSNGASTTNEPDKSVFIEQYYVDKDYIETLKIDIKAGRSFITEESDKHTGVILNSTAVNSLNLTDPVGKTIITKTMFDNTEKEYEIIGVTDDFISGTVHRGIGPVLLFSRTPTVPARHIAVRLKNQLSESGRIHIQDVWSNLTEGKPIELHFMDDLFQELYKKESTISKILTFFTVLAIFISCLGLFGLSLFVARRKNKEIGIRKVHGAQIVDIVKMILREFVFTVILANFLALPITLISMRKWLSLFAYKIKPDISLFIIAFILSAFIVSLTLTINALKVARMNPAESLRDE